jgi:putative ABC transport system ATP-binding protein
MLVWRDLSHRYPGGPTLHYADFSLPAGQHLLLKGASGSGKSTLLALLAGLLRVQAGALEVAGEALAGRSARELDAWRGRALGVVPQRLHLSEALSVAENLALPAFALGERADAARAQALMSSLRIEALADRRPHQLSVGQAQRVAVARALMRRPRLLLADEPSASLDDAHAEQMLDLLLEAAQREACTLVVASHDSRVFARLGQREDFFQQVLA